jgi:hypothetical protein
VADIAWTALTIVLVIVSLVVVALGFPGRIGKKARFGLFRRLPPTRGRTPPDETREA